MNLFCRNFSIFKNKIAGFLYGDAFLFVCNVCVCVLLCVFLEFLLRFNWCCCFDYFGCNCWCVVLLFEYTVRCIYLFRVFLAARSLDLFKSILRFGSYVVCFAFFLLLFLVWICVLLFFRFCYWLLRAVIDIHTHWLDDTYMLLQNARRPKKKAAYEVTDFQPVSKSFSLFALFALRLYFFFSLSVFWIFICVDFGHCG